MSFGKLSALWSSCGLIVTFKMHTTSIKLYDRSFWKILVIIKIRGYDAHILWFYSHCVPFVSVHLFDKNLLSIFEHFCSTLLLWDLLASLVLFYSSVLSLSSAHIVMSLCSALDFYPQQRHHFVLLSPI